MSGGELEELVRELLFNRYDEKEREIGPENMRTLERMITLQVIDSKWREHLLNMDELRDGIWAVGYSERNPLVEYKLRGFDIFNETMDGLMQEVLEYLFKVQVREEYMREEEREYRVIGQEVTRRPSSSSAPEEFSPRTAVPYATLRSTAPSS